MISTDGVVIVKWLDNRSVCLASNFVGSGEEDRVQRWSKETNTYVAVPRPEIVKLYNHAVGGVDLLDQLISLYIIYIRSIKSRFNAFSHTDC